MTHKGLVGRAKRWLLGTGRCTIAVTEFSTSTFMEIPDAIGFHGSKGESILIECKISRADFLCDRHKIFRLFPEHGMGNERYFLAPKEMIKVEELQEGWGLLELEERNDLIYKALEAKKQSSNKQHEVSFLVSIIRRLEMSTCVYVISEPPA